MVINRGDMKRKRKENCTSPLLDDSPKRTKVHAQRKFAQGSNVNSPVITPVKEIEREDIDVLPEPVELLPIKRPNTEDFLTFLCFRGTPILPPNLNFFNTASIVDTNGQVHEIKSESPKNGPIDTSGISKAGAGSSERPFVAFGVRKRADPIVISRQMDKKRRHALALQALRRKYQEQRMAKIRAVTISKLSEKVTSKTIVRSNSITKTEVTPKKSENLHKTKVTVVSTKHVKVTTQTGKSALRPQIKQKMCLRSFRGRFVQKELQFRNVKKRPIPTKPFKKRKGDAEKEEQSTAGEDKEQECSSDDEKPLSKAAKVVKLAPKVALSRIVKKCAPGPKKPMEINFRITRSNKFPSSNKGTPMITNKIAVRRQQIKQRMLLNTPKTIVKPRTLRSNSILKVKLVPDKKISVKKLSKNEKAGKEIHKVQTMANKKSADSKSQSTENKKPTDNKLQSIESKKPTDNKIQSTESKKPTVNKPQHMESKKTADGNDTNKKVVKEAPKKDSGIKNPVSGKREIKSPESTKKTANATKYAVSSSSIASSVIKTKVPSKTCIGMKKDIKLSDPVKKEPSKLKLALKQLPKPTTKKVGVSDFPSKKEDVTVKKVTKTTTATKKITNKTETVLKKDVSVTKKEIVKDDEPNKKEVSKPETKEPVELKTLQRPTRKTKEAAAIYMELLSHKLVNESKNLDDDDNVSIDSFPELPNVKKTEQRENELKAKAKSIKTTEEEPVSENKVKEADVESKSLRSGEKKIGIPQQKKETVVLKKEEKVEIKDDRPKKSSEETEVKKQEDDNDKKVADETKKIIPKVKKDEMVKEKSSVVCDRRTRLNNVEKVGTCSVEKVKEIELKVQLNALDAKKVIITKPDTKDDNKRKTTENLESEAKKKQCSKPTDKETQSSDGSVKELKLKKPSVGNSKKKEKKPQETIKRETRNSSYAAPKESDDSDESFRIDIKIRRKKQNTRSKNSRSYSTDSDRSEDKSDIKKSLRTCARSYKECDFSVSDFCSTSEEEAKKTKNVVKTKNLCKKKNRQKSESFSDSDEEPLSKLTQSKTVEIKEPEPLKTEPIEKKIAKESETKIMKKIIEPVVDVVVEQKEIGAKPKRECAKRPQYYLPMFSSSDEDDAYFHGFKTKTEIIPTVPKTNNKNQETTCSHLLPTSSDLSCKDIGLRFGKGKVNMSKEQIEQWLKDSALAGNSVKKENDAMLKFGEEIPTETSLQVASSIDINRLKILLATSEEKHNIAAANKEASSSNKSVGKMESATNNMDLAKPVMIDRKLIFRNKDKIRVARNINAFSVSNESSVYAFGVEEEVMKTPFRRPSRRPSSTATSRSEDETPKSEDTLKAGQFRKPPTVKPELTKLTTDAVEENISVDAEIQRLKPSGTGISLLNVKCKTHTSEKFNDRPTSSSTTSMVPPSQMLQKSRDTRTLKQPTRSFDKSSEASEEFKYKIPSSPSASSSSSAKLYKKQNAKPKFRAVDVAPVKLSDFPSMSNTHYLVEAPTFHPTDKEFQDPLEFIEKIRPKAEQFGICRIVPPSTFKPECKVTDDMRFTAYNQYVHKMLHRWGPNFKELMAIRKYLSTQNISLTHPPWIGGMEIDLPRLYQTVQSLGGLKEVIEKKKWPKVSDLMKIPKLAQDRVTKLDDIYCKYLLPYDTLSPAEREKLFDEVETDWAKRESKSLLKAQQELENEEEESESETDDEAEECIMKGRSMALNAFYRIARNTMSMWFKTSEPTAQEVEQEFWKHVTLKQNHICVHSGSIDSGSWGYGFAVSKNSPFARHAWNLKVLTNNSGSVLRSLGPIMGVTVPTLHVGMVFSSCCWYRDPHSLPWIEYLHTGGNKIWYGIPNSTSAAFHNALKKLVPNYCRNKTLWLPSDTVMVPPSLLIENGVSLCRIVQEPGQFIVVFPKVFTSSLSTGYVVSESVYFAPPYWLNTSRDVFDHLRNSCEPSMFSLDRLLLSIVSDSRSNVDVLRQIIPAVTKLCDTEKMRREKIKSLGITSVEKLPLPEAPNVRKKKKMHGEDGDYECEICRVNLFITLVIESEEDAAYCLDHAVELIEKEKILIKNCKLMFTYNDEELAGLVGRIHTAIENKLLKKIPNKYAGMPTLLTK